MLRTVLAVVVGYIACTILTITGFAVLTAVEGEYAYQRPEVLAGLVIFGVVCAAAGGWVAARMAENRHVRHAVYLGSVMVVFGLLSIFFSPSSSEPFWFRAVLILIAPPSTWLGGKLRERQLASLTPHG